MPLRKRLATFGRRTKSVFAAALTTLLVAGVMVSAGSAAIPAQAQSAAVLGVDKQVTFPEGDVKDLKPGDEVTYRIEMTHLNADVDGATILRDVLPEAFGGWTLKNIQHGLTNAPEATTLVSPAGWDPAGGIIDPDTELVLAVDDNGSVPSGDQAFLEYTVVIPKTLTPDWQFNGTDLVNEVVYEADDNPTGSTNLRAEDNAGIAVDVEENHDVGAEKTWAPAEQDFAPGAESTITLKGTNSSNVIADRLIIADPAGDPTIENSPFSKVDFAGFSSPPTDAVAVEVFVDGAWVPYVSDDHDNEEVVLGVRAVYENVDIDGSEEFSFTVTQRETDQHTGDPLGGGWDTDNELTVVIEDENEEPQAKDSDEATFTANPLIIDVGVVKDFLDSDGNPVAPLEAVVGDEVGVGLSAVNSGEQPLHELTIREPGQDAAELFFGEDITFNGFTGSATEQWPEGAESATLTWYTEDGDPQMVQLEAGDGLPTPTEGVTGFELTFFGEIPPQAESELHFDITVSENLSTEDLADLSNVVEVEGKHKHVTDPVTDEDDATLRVVEPGIDVETDKRVGPTTVFPGDNVIVQLPTEATAQGVKTRITDLTVTDEYPVEDGEGTFWDAYNLTGIAAPVDVPEGLTLTINTRDADGEWTELGSYTESPGALSIDNPEDVYGVQFVYTDENGNLKELSVKPNLQFEARSELRSGGATAANGEVTSYTNTVVADGEAKLNDKTVTDKDDAETDGKIRDREHGPGPLHIDKKWNDASLASQSSANTSSIQHWTVAGTGFDQIFLVDPLNLDGDIKDSVFDVFNLTGIDPITHSDDPMIKWDIVAAVELYDGDEWITVDAPSGGWMNDEGFIGYALSADQQANTLGVRLVLEENAEARQQANDPVMPQEGDGVAASAEKRAYTLNWQLRDKLRSEDVWVTGNEQFNCEIEPPAEKAGGCVDNTVLIEGERDGNRNQDSDSSQIMVIDPKPNVKLTKEIDENNKSLIVPRPGDLDENDERPSTTYTLTAKNVSGSATTEGAMRLGQIRVTDEAFEENVPPMDGNPFEGRNFADEDENHFNVFDLTGITFDGLPSYIDKDQSKVSFWVHDSGDVVNYSIAEVQAGDAVDVFPNTIGVSVIYQGTDPKTDGSQIVAGDALTMKLGMELRATERVSGDVIEGGITPIVQPNTASTMGQEYVVDQTKTANSTAKVEAELKRADLNIQLDKAVTVNNPEGFADDTLFEAHPDSPVTVTLHATPGDATSGTNRVTVEDQSSDFWETFKLNDWINGADTAPAGTDATVFYLIEGDWLTQDQAEDQDFTLEDVQGVRMTFEREDGLVFPRSAAAQLNQTWTASFNFDVTLRDANAVDWSDFEIENTATTLSERTDEEAAEDESDAVVPFSGGEHKLTVVKRAPNDTGNHVVDPLNVETWKLEFTNSGTSLLPITTVTDKLPDSLEWDGETPVITTDDDGTLTTEGIEVELNENNELLFSWSEGATMRPGETAVIDLGLILKPGLSASERALNTVVVDTGVPLADCTQPTEYGQDPSAVGELSDTECGNTNFVAPRSGTLIGSSKYVNGESIDTLGEKLVNGGYNTSTEEECTETDWKDGDFTRTPCAAYTAVGATDTWKLGHVNTGTNPLGKMVIVDMLPTPGDKYLAGDAQRGSTFRPVLDLDSFDVTGLPEGANYTISLTEDPLACNISDGESQWGKPGTEECDSVVDDWVNLEDYSGVPEAVAGFRIIVEMQDEALKPGGAIDVQFDTVNVLDATEDALPASLEKFQTPQYAWNQNGVIAWDTQENRVRLPSAPKKAGVTMKTGSLELWKTVNENDVEVTHEAFTADLACTVPSGKTDPERVPLDLGEFSEVKLPADGTPVRIDGLPIGADCEVSEQGELGAFGEIGRSIVDSPGVDPSADGMSAQLQVREPRAGDEATLVNLTNTYALGQLVIEKQARSLNEHALSDEQAGASYDFTLMCENPAKADEQITEEVITLKSGEQHVIDNLPQGAECEISETDAAGAKLTTVSVNGDVVTEDLVEGEALESLKLGDEPTYVLVTNGFDGVPPGDGESKLPWTGSNLTWMIIAAIILLAVGGGVMAINRNRKSSKD